MENSKEFVSVKTLAKRLDRGVSTVWNDVKRGLLPQPDVRMGQRCTRWDWGNVVAFLERQNSRTTGAGA